MRSLGRLLQLAGLTILPCALLLGLLPGNNREGYVISPGQELAVMALGACLFGIGYLLAGAARR